MQNRIDIQSFFNRFQLTSLLLLIFSSGLFAQTLFTVDGSPVTKEEFLKAFTKNNNGVAATDKAYRDYLDLYIRYKLKEIGRASCRERVCAIV